MQIERQVTIGGRLVSSVQKREILWNSIEPGDPYDIRKSMIAKLPGRKNFMGQHLELVCLLQAAQIERISEFLEDYKLRFRQIERRDLDRHSFEVQIKELTEQIGDEGASKTQNAKLRQFLRKQTSELDELKKAQSYGPAYDSELMRKYEDSLKQIELLFRENQFLKSRQGQVREYQQIIDQKSFQIEELQRRLKMQPSSARSQEAIRNEAYLKLEIDYKKLEFEFRRFKDMNDAKSRQIDDLQNKSRQLIYQIEQKNNVINQYANINHTIQEYENRFGLFGQQIDRLNLVLREKANELNDLGNRYKMGEEDHRRKNQYINELEGKIKQIQESYRALQKKNYEKLQATAGLEDSRVLIRTYEANLEKLSLQIERLNSVLKRKIDELDDALRKNHEYQYELQKNQGIKREIEDFGIKYAEFNKKIVTYENKISLLSQQIDRLNQVIKRKTDDADALEQQFRNQSIQLEELSRKLYEMDIEHKAEINHITQNYEEHIYHIKQENQAKFDDIMALKLRDSPSKQNLQKEQALIQEIERLTQILRNMEAEKQGFNEERHRMSQQFQFQLNRRAMENDDLRLHFGEYERRIILLIQQNERLSNISVQPQISNESQKTRMGGLQIERLLEVQRRNVDEIKRLEITINNYQNELKNMHAYLSENQYRVREFERINRQGLLENDRLKQELNYLQQQLNQKINEEKQLNATVYQSRETEEKLRRVFEENKHLMQRLDQYDSQIGTLSAQINRLNSILKIKIDENTSFQQRFSIGRTENEQMRKRINEYQSKIALLAQQTERLRESLSMRKDQSGSLLDEHKKALSDIENYKRRIIELQNSFRDRQNQYRGIDQKVRTAQLQAETLKSNLTETNRRISEYESKTYVLSQEIERLNGILQKLSRQNNDLMRKKNEADQLKMTVVTLQERFSRVSQDNQELRQRNNESNLTKTKFNQEYEGRIRALSQQNEKSYRTIQELQSKIAFLAQELQNQNSVMNENLNSIAGLQARLRSSNQQNDNLNRKIQELSNASRKIIEYENKISVLSQQIQRLNSILKKKLQECNGWESKCRMYEQELEGFKRKMNELDNNVIRDLQNKNSYLNKQNEELKFRIKQLNSEVSKVADLQNKLTLILSEVERLNGNLKLKMEQNSSLGNKNRNIEQQLQKYRRRYEEMESTMHRDLKSQSSVFQQRIVSLSTQNQDLRRKLREISDANRIIPEFESKFAVMSQQIERLNGILMKYSKEIVPALEEKIKTANYERDECRKRLGELDQANKNNKQILSRLNIVTRQRDDYGRRIQEYEARLAQFAGEIQRLTGLLRQKVEESSSFEGRFRQSLAENEQLGKKIKQISEIHRVIPEYESKIALLSQEVERLNAQLRIKMDEVNAAQSKMRMDRHDFDVVQRKCAELQVQLSEYKNNRLVLEQKIASLSSENDELRKGIRQLSDSNRRIVQYESRIALLSQQIERLNGNLKIKYEELNSAENIFKNYKRDAESKLLNLNNELQQSRRRVGENYNATASRIAEYQSKITKLTQEMQSQSYRIRESSFEIQNVQKKQGQYLAEIERLNNTLRLKVQECTRWDQANAELKSKLREYEQNMTGFGSEYEKLKSSYAILTEEYNKANKHLVEYEQSINKLYQQFERLQAVMQQLKKQNYELKRLLDEANKEIGELTRRLQELQTLRQEHYDLKLKLQQAGNLFEMNKVLSAEIERLQKILQTQKEDLEQLRLNYSNQAALQKRIKEDMTLMVVLFAQIESLRIRVNDTEKQIDLVRRSSLAPFKV